MDCKQADRSGHVEALSTVIQGTSINFLGAFSRNVLGFVFVVLLSRFLSTADLGLYYLAFNAVSIAGLLGMLGIDSGVLRFLSIYHGCRDPENMKAVLHRALAVSLPLSAAVALALAVFSHEISVGVFSKPDLSPVLRIMSLYVVLSTLTLVLLAATQAMKHMQYRVYAMDITNTMLKIALVALFYFAFGLRLYGAVLACVLSIGIASIMAGVFVLRVFPRSGSKGGKRPQLRKLLSFSIPQSFSALMHRGVGVSDTLLLGYFTVAASVGIYTVAVKILMLLTCVLVSFNMMFSPMIADLHHRQRLTELATLYGVVTKWIFTLSLPLCLFAVLFADRILIAFGKEFEAGVGCLVILCIGQMINAATGPSGLMVSMSGHQYINLFNNVLTIVLNVGLHVILIPRYGIAGAAMSTASSLAFVNILRVIEVYFLMGMQPYELGYFKAIIAALVAGLLIGCVMQCSIEGNGIVFLMLFGCAFFAVYAGVLIALRLDDEDAYILSRIRQRLPLPI